jgi:AraC-like DNA-binding protein
MSATGFTKARSMGPVADAVERGGGSLRRVFQRADLPLRLMNEPDQLILLKDQLALVECAARELGDETLSLRLSMQAGFAGLGVFGQWVGAATDLQQAILRCNAGIMTLLQSMTHMTLSIREDQAIWTYEITDDVRIGRQKNELLAFGYMSDTLRHFAKGGSMRAQLPQALPARSAAQDALGCEISIGERAALIFPRELLASANPILIRQAPTYAADVPEPDDLVASVEHLARLELLEGVPMIQNICRRLGLSHRTLQRRLAQSGTHFEDIRRGVVLARADALLRRSRPSITEIAFELGYSDPAHFARAIVNWTGETPSARRRRLSSP